MNQIKSLNGLKFFAALIIVLYHVDLSFRIPYPFRHGDLGVELFFVIAGFFLAKTYEKMTSSPAQKRTPSQLCKKYFFHRFKRLWPECFFAAAVSLGLVSIFSDVKIQPFFLNMFMMTGWGGIPIFFSAFWFISVLFWCGCLLFNLLVLEKEKAKTIIFPVIAVFCLFYLVNSKDYFSGALDLSFGYLSKGTVRGLLGLIIGIYTYWGCEMLRSCKTKWNPKFVSVSLFLMEVISVAGLGHIFIFQRKFSVNLFNVYFYISFLIGLLYFRKEKLLRFLSWKIWIPFATISYSLYLVHTVILRVFQKYFTAWTRTHITWGFALIALSSVIFAFFFYYTQLYLRKALKKLMFKK